MEITRNFKPRVAYVGNTEYNSFELLYNLSSTYPELGLSGGDLDIMDGEWVIDGMDPYE